MDPQNKNVAGKAIDDFTEQNEDLHDDNLNSSKPMVIDTGSENDFQASESDWSPGSEDFSDGESSTSDKLPTKGSFTHPRAGPHTSSKSVFEDAAERLRLNMGEINFNEKPMEAHSSMGLDQATQTILSDETLHYSRSFKERQKIHSYSFLCLLKSSNDLEKQLDCLEKLKQKLIIVHERCGVPFEASNNTNESSPPRSESSSPRNESSSPRNESSSPMNESSSPRDESSSPMNESSPPRDESSSPRDESSSPMNESSPPRNESSSPRNESSPPMNESSPPMNESSPPMNEYSPPRNESNDKNETAEKSPEKDNNVIEIISDENDDDSPTLQMNDKSSPVVPPIPPANDSDMVPIGSGRTEIPRHIYNQIKWNSYTSATRKLLMAVFPRMTLATHSLTGKSSPAFSDRAPKMKLDTRKVTDIVMVVSHLCNVKDNLVRNIITTKCSDENKMYRMRLKKMGNFKKNKGRKD